MTSQQAIVRARSGGRATLQIFATSPSSLNSDPAVYARQVAEVARWSEDAGCAGTLIYTDNSIVDGWLVAQIVIQATRSLCPLVAVQPVYAHPYSIAKLVSSIAHLHGRKVYLNMVAGGFTNDLTALNDTTPHDRRYARLVEYTSIIKSLLEGDRPAVYQGEFYKIDKPILKPPLPPDLFPGIFVSGSSEAGMAAAIALNATAVKYPGPASECELQAPPAGVEHGIRVGIIARADPEEAWRIAYERFPEDRKGRLTHDLSMRVSDSAWHKRLSSLGRSQPQQESPYWLVPFETAKTNCPYLVGSYADVARELSRYKAAGYNTFILDIPPCREELEHIGLVLDRAAQEGGSL
jgi:alkanesulfonate monooxygenase